jgi:hypothetical protein
MESQHQLIWALKQYERASQEMLKIGRWKENMVTAQSELCRGEDLLRVGDVLWPGDSTELKRSRTFACRGA